MNDPNQIRLLDEVLESLRYKNGQAQKVDGQISDFMHPDAKKAKKQLEREAEEIRKQNNSAVMPVKGIKTDVTEPTGLTTLFQRHGMRNNKKVPPQEQNKFYQALTKDLP